VHKVFDLIGRIRYEGKQRVLDFCPAEGATICKNAAHWDPILLPDLHERQSFLAELITEAKLRIGKTAANSALVAQTVDAFAARLGQDPTLEAFNALAQEALALKGGAPHAGWAPGEGARGEVRPHLRQEAQGVQEAGGSGMKSTGAYASAFPLHEGSDGMTMREWYAGQALQGILANPTWNWAAISAHGLSESGAVTGAANMAFLYADAMLAAAKRGGPA
jgi:hypothetical protein